MGRQGEVQREFQDVFTRLSAIKSSQGKTLLCLEVPNRGTDVSIYVPGSSKAEAFTVEEPILRMLHASPFDVAAGKQAPTVSLLDMSSITVVAILVKALYEHLGNTYKHQFAISQQDFIFNTMPHVKDILQSVQRRPYLSKLWQSPGLAAVWFYQFVLIMRRGWFFMHGFPTEDTWDSTDITHTVTVCWH